MVQHPSLRIVKIWECNGPTLVLQVQGFGPGMPLGLKRFYLVVDANQRTAGVRGLLSKPEDIRVGGAVANLARKHLPTSRLEGVYRDHSSDGWWLPLYTRPGAQAQYYLHLAMALPPELQLISAEMDILVRKSSQGTYTKRRDFPGSLSLEKCDNVTPQLLNSLEQILANNLNAESEAPEDSDSDVAIVSQSAAVAVLPDYQRDARDRLARKLKTVKKALEKVIARTRSPSEIKDKERAAELLKSNLFRLRPGAHELTVTDVQNDDSSITISVDPELSPGANLERAYIELRKLRRAFKIGQKQRHETEKERDALEADLNNLRTMLHSEADVAIILNRYQLPLVKPAGGQRAAGPAAKPWKTYKLVGYADDQIIEVLVGKSAQDNDELCKQARANDWWLHAVGVTGSHVIIPARQLKTEVGPALLKAAGVLALHHSRLKNDLAGEVYVTKRRFLRKRKGMPAGLWQIDQAETMFVRYSELELKQLATMQVF